ncbi:hypothetical protein BJ944DRAFT_253436 [Cunninghamella echinulata]|nr:hypothetical protein BJ944DRAFT_253436 [Cunninghamella echinulata]
MGDVTHTLEEWNNNPYKYEIMKNDIMFKEFLHKISVPKWYWPCKIGPKIGNMGNVLGYIDTPIMTIFFGDFTIGEYINCFEEAVNQVAERFIKIPKSLSGTDLGRLKHCNCVQSNKCYELLSNFGLEICEINPTGIMVIFKLKCKDEIHCEDFLNEHINVASCGNTDSGFVCIIK